MDDRKKNAFFFVGDLTAKIFLERSDLGNRQNVKKSEPAEESPESTEKWYKYVLQIFIMYKGKGRRRTLISVMLIFFVNIEISCRFIIQNARIIYLLQTFI